MSVVIALKKAYLQTHHFNYLKNGKQGLNAIKHMLQEMGYIR
jgi:hypothetical protein